MRLGLTEIGIVVIIALVLFGGKLIPKIGKKIRESGNALKEEMEKTSKEFSEEKEG